MAFSRGDLVFIYFKLPNQREEKPHPVIILSNRNLYNADESYVGVMATHYDEIDEFSFVLENDMFIREDDNREFTQARCHLITYLLDSHISPKRAIDTLKQSAVNKLVAHINNVSLSEDED